MVSILGFSTSTRDFPLKLGSVAQDDTLLPTSALVAAKRIAPLGFGGGGFGGLFFFFKKKQRKVGGSRKNVYISLCWSFCLRLFECFVSKIRDSKLGCLGGLVVLFFILSEMIAILTFLHFATLALYC